MILLAQFGINKHSQFFSKTTNSTGPLGPGNIFVVFENVALAYLFQIALEINWLPIHITSFLRLIVAISKWNENDRFQSIMSFFGGLMKTPLLSSAGFVCLRVGYREVFWEEYSRLTWRELSIQRPLLFWVHVMFLHSLPSRVGCSFQG